MKKPRSPEAQQIFHPTSQPESQVPATAGDGRNILLIMDCDSAVTSSRIVAGVADDCFILLYGSIQ